MDIQVDWLGVLVAAAAGMAVGSVWYSKVLFGKQWQQLVGLKDSDMKQGATAAMAKAALLTLLKAYVLSHIVFLSHSFYNYGWVQTGLTSAVWVWLGFVATSHIMQGAFEQRDNKLVLLNITNELVTLLVMGAIVGAFLGS